MARSIALAKVLLVVVIALAWWWQNQAQVVQALEARHEAMVAMLAGGVAEGMTPALLISGAGRGAPLSTVPEAVALERMVGRLLAGTPGVGVALIGTSGQTLYSRMLVGQGVAGMAEFRHCVTTLTRQHTLEGGRLTSFVPLLTGDGKLAAVWVMASDVSREMARLRSLAWGGGGVLLLVGVLLWLYHLQVMHRARFAMHQQCQEVAAAMDAADWKNKQLTLQLARCKELAQQAGEGDPGSPDP